jgi:hypothetical protein
LIPKFNEIIHMRRQTFSSSTQYRIGCWSLFVLVAVIGVPGIHAAADDYADVSKMLRAGQVNEAMVKADQYLAGKPQLYLKCDSS